MSVQKTLSLNWKVQLKCIRSDTKLELNNKVIKYDEGQRVLIPLKALKIRKNKNVFYTNNL